MKRVIFLLLFALTACVKPNLTPTATLDANEFIDEQGVHMRLVPAGEFTMGNEIGDVSASPAHQVTLDTYYIDKYEVTNALFKTCVDKGVCQEPDSLHSMTRDNYYGNSQFDNYPVVFVNWYMAKTFCEWRGARLPTEAEWEKAARGNDNANRYPWNSSECIFMHDETAKEGCAGGTDTAEIGYYENNQSSYGVYDMPGNVWEWVSSLYKPYPYNADDGREDLSSADRRVVRSGFRYIGFPYASMNTVGFRCARAVP